MRTLAGDNVSEDFLKNIWMQRLPRQTQAILAPSQSALSALAEQADRIAEVGFGGSIAAVDHRNHPKPQSTQDDWAEVKKALYKINKRLDFLETNQKRNSRRDSSTARDKGSRTRSPSRQEASNQNASGICYFHNKFGDAATKCVKPCKFPTTGN